MPDAEQKQDVAPTPASPTADVGPVQHRQPASFSTATRLTLDALVRFILVVTGSGTFIYIVLASFHATRTFEDVRTLIDIFVPISGALLGAGAAFYFAERSAHDDSHAPH